MSTDTPHYAGHRARLRERLLKDSTALADYEILELLLGYALLRRDTKPLAKELLSRFGSIRGVLDALPAEMQQVDGVGEGVAALRLLLREMMARYAEAPMRERKVLCTPRDVAQMVIPRFSPRGTLDSYRRCPKPPAHLGAAGAGDGRHGSVLSEGHFGAGAPAQGKRLLSGAQPSRRDAEGFARGH